MRRLLLAALALASLLLLPAVAHAQRGDVKVQLLGLNDFHGHLESTTPGRISASGVAAESVPAGGAEYLATHVRELEKQNPNTLVVSAGDLIGASPLLSALFRDEPTIEAMNRIGLDLNATGNHEFDDGAEELRRMQEGGCHPTDGCLDGDEFGGADFRFLSANVVGRRTRRPLLKPFVIRKFDGVKVGFIGMTLQGTPDIVAAAGIRGLDFLDEAETANRYAAVLRRRHGVRAIVVLLHEGASQAPGSNVNSCTGISGPVVDIVSRTTKAVDLFVTGHTHQAYNCVIDGRRVTSASSFGRLVTDIDLTIDRRRRDVVEASANNRVITQDVARAPDLTELIARYSTLAAPLANRVIGRIGADITRTPDPSGEQAAGNLIADAQLASTASPDTGGAVAAFMNPGGVRSDFVFAPSGGEAPGDVTYGEAFTVQPFGNTLTTLTLTGAQVRLMLKSQWCGQSFARILLPSASVSYTWSRAAATAALGQPCASAPDPVSDVAIGGFPITDDGRYRITVNSFLAEGGDLFAVLREGTERVGGPLDADSLEAYLRTSLAGAPIAPPALDRITVVP